MKNTNNGILVYFNTFTSQYSVQSLNSEHCSGFTMTYKKKFTYDGKGTGTNVPLWLRHCFTVLLRCCGDGNGETYPLSSV